MFGCSPVQLGASPDPGPARAGDDKWRRAGIELNAQWLRVRTRKRGSRGDGPRGRAKKAWRGDREGRRKQLACRKVRTYGRGPDTAVPRKGGRINRVDPSILKGTSEAGVSPVSERSPARQAVHHIHAARRRGDRGGDERPRGFDATRRGWKTRIDQNQTSRLNYGSRRRYRGCRRIRG